MRLRLSPIGQIGLDPGMYTASDTEAITVYSDSPKNECVIWGCILAPSGDYD